MTTELEIEKGAYYIGVLGFVIICIGIFVLFATTYQIIGGILIVVGGIGLFMYFTRNIAILGYRG